MHCSLSTVIFAVVTVPLSTMGLLRPFIVTRFFMFFAGRPSANQLGSGSPTHRGKRAGRLLVFLGVLALVAVGCSDDDASPEASTETTATSTTTTTAAPTTTTTAAPTTTTAAAPIEVPLPADVTETHEIPGFGYSIDYPAGWSAETRGTLTLIASTEERLAAGFANSEPDEPIDGLGISLIYLPVAELQTSLGLTTDDPTAEDMLEFNKTLETNGVVDWTDVRDQTEVEVFGVPAIRVRVTAAVGGEFIAYQGIRAETGEPFLFSFGAPTGEILDEFLPTWDAMFESITETE